MIFKGLKGKYSILSFHLSHQTKPNLSGSAREASVAVWWIHTISGKVGSHFSSRTNGREEKEREERLYLWSVSLWGLIPMIVWIFLLLLLFYNCFNPAFFLFFICLILSILFYFYANWNCFTFPFSFSFSSSQILACVPMKNDVHMWK